MSALSKLLIVAVVVAVAYAIWYKTRRPQPERDPPPPPTFRCRFDRLPFTDESANGLRIENAGMTIDAGNTLFGAPSARSHFDGRVYVYADNDPRLLQLRGDFTLDFFVWLTGEINPEIVSDGPGDHFILAHIPDADETMAYEAGLILRANSDVSHFNSTVAMPNEAGWWPKKRWLFVRVVRRDGTVTLYTDGVARGSVKQAEPLNVHGNVLAIWGGGAVENGSGCLRDVTLWNGTALPGDGYVPRS